MAVNMSNPPAEPSPSPVMVSSELYCALTGRSIMPHEAYWASPLITTRDLISTLVNTALHAPSNLGQILFGEQPNVPYAPEARKELAARRSTEQLKLLMLIMLLAALIIVPIVLVVL